MKKHTVVVKDGENLLSVNTNLATLIAGEDPNNDCLITETQDGYEIFDRSTATADEPLGAVGDDGDKLTRVRVLVAPATTALDIYDGDVATGELVLSIPATTAVGTTYECGFLSKNGGFTCDDDANDGKIIAIGRFT